jgi:hypothetical protein
MLRADGVRDRHLMIEIRMQLTTSVRVCFHRQMAGTALFWRANRRI